jgi:hypothetical protein
VDSACVQSSDIDSARESLFAQLASLPPDIRAEIVKMALTKGVSVETARQNMSNSDNGHIFVYMYYINTRFTGGQTLEGTYESCVLASGVRLVVGETVVGSEEERTTDIAGYQPCHCGMFYCEKCPIIKEIVTSRSVFSRYYGTIKWHTHLGQLLAEMAARQVGALHQSVHANFDEKVATSWTTHIG